MRADALAGSVALVTGAARPRGIGRATALALAAAGADVACLDIARPYESAPAHALASGDDLATVVAEITALGRRAFAVQADVSRADEVEAAVAAASDALGTITLVANVAGGSGAGFGLGPLITLDEAEFRHVLEVNVIGTWLVARACASCGAPFRSQLEDACPYCHAPRADAQAGWRLDHNYLVVESVPR